MTVASDIQESQTKWRSRLPFSSYNMQGHTSSARACMQCARGSLTSRSASRVHVALRVQHVLKSIF